MSKTVAEATNFVSLLNEFCQKNKLNYVLEKYCENGQSHCRIFTVRLRIHHMGDAQNSLEFFGEGSTLKEARCDACRLASEVDIKEALRKLHLESKLDLASNSKVNPNSGLNDLAKELSYMTLTYDQKDKIYDIWNHARKHRLSISLEFVRVRKYITKKTVEVRLSLANVSYKGKGPDDLEAIYDSVKNVDLKELPKAQSSDEYDEFSDDESSHCVSRLHEVHQQMDKPLEFTCLITSGPPQDPVFIHKCILGDLVTYGIGKNKKCAKNQAATRMVRKVDGDVDLESVSTQTSIFERYVDEKLILSVAKALDMPDNAISVLEGLDKARNGPKVRYTEMSQQIGVQSHFTTECKVLLGPDLKIRPDDLTRNSIKKNGVIYLKTSSRSTKKKTSKMEAAEKMVNLLKGKGANTNEEVIKNLELKEFQENTFSLKKDIIDKNSINQEYYNVLVDAIDSAAEFLKDKPNYDPDYCFLSEIVELEFENKDHISLTIRTSNEVYERFPDIDYEPYITCLINFKCGINISALSKSLDEMESKNQAAFIILQKLSKISKKDLC